MKRSTAFFFNLVFKLARALPCELFDIIWPSPPPITWDQVRLDFEEVLSDYLVVNSGRVVHCGKYDHYL